MTGRNRWLVMGVIALLAGCEPEGVKPPESRSLGNDDADQVVVGMDQTVTSNGVRKSYVIADTAFMYTRTQRADLRRFKVTFFDDQGKELGTLVAEQGNYQFADGSLDARGNVVVIGADGEELRTPHLIYNGTTQMITSDSSFVYTTKTDRLAGVGFESDRELKKVVGKRATYEQTGPGVEMDGQQEQ